MIKLLNFYRFYTEQKFNIFTVYISIYFSKLVKGLNPYESHYI